uniref:Uncharacterized protein n=1 Tax=viral metagenome TaxID=1070528 RepID=A0A6C0ENI5_9ZZZZ
MNLINIGSAVAWVDFFTIVLSKVFHLGKSLDKWYANFGIVAVLSDCLVIVLGIMIAQFIVPGAKVLTLVVVSIIIQIVHDVLFYYAVILGVPRDQNSMIDLFKEYAIENSWKILVADSLMIGSTVLLAHYLSKLNTSHSSFIGLLGVYGLTYIMYTK